MKNISIHDNLPPGMNAKEPRLEIVITPHHKELFPDEDDKVEDLLKEIPSVLLLLPLVMNCYR